MSKIGSAFCLGNYFVILMIICVVNISTLEIKNLSERIYIVDSSLNCYINAKGTLSNGKNNLDFTNIIESGKLTKLGDKLNSTVIVTDNVLLAGEYVGKINFKINFFAE